MPKKKTIAELEAEKAYWEKSLEQLAHRETRINNCIRYLNEVDRKKRTHHLCTRMGYIEHCVPALKELTEPEFYDLFDVLLNLPGVKERIEQAVRSHSGKVCDLSLYHFHVTQIKRSAGQSAMLHIIC